MSKAKHPKAASFARQHLFAGVTSFAEVEARIAALPDEQARGDAFEVFAEAYLATQRKHDAAQVWPLASVPSNVLQTLGLAAQDYGVDGVFQTLLGHYNAYQVKFRTDRSALTWRELSTFMGLADSPNIRSRVLLTNCDDLPSVLNERQGFFCIRGSDLDRLEADDFRAIEAWLADAAFTAPKKQPQPHQIEALDALLPALETNDRVSAIMACGTGKTLVALWLAERRQASRILVLVPSLALLRQTLHEWLRETSLPSLAYLCVCSDPTVKEGLDSIATAQSDLDFQVSTDAASVRGFFDAPFSGAKVVFSTYQSAQVAGAALKAGEAFDLGVFDEAHKTAGREGRNYAFALEDSNLPIRKRLFLTATPRHYNPHQHDREGDAQLVFSMDRPEVYGPQAFRLTFAEAARRGIICGYKVIISVITSEMVTNELLSRGEVIVNGDPVRARQVANQIALRDAIERYGTSKVFTFHRDVKSAQSFVSNGPEGVGTHLANVAADVRRLTSNSQTSDECGNASQSLVTSAATSGFQTFHVNGTMPTAHREREMRDFRAAARAVMSNARCLTEGVDVPAVDMVAFLSPRRSRVDIVQATGRAMRRSPGKTTGYVLVPLYVEQAANETVEAAVSRSDFDEVWDVLHSLQEQDDVLAELIRNAGEQKGRSKGFDDSGFADRVEIVGLKIGLEALRSAVTTRCFESLFSSWDTFFGKLNVFKERFGHCNVPQDWEDPALPSWMGRQRQKRELLSRDQIERLDEVGFIWDVQRLVWDEMFAKLQMFKDRFGHCNVETGWKEDPALAGWVGAQRTRRNKGLVDADRILQLDSIGFVWVWNKAKGQETWMKWYRELESYAKEHGNTHVPRTHANTKLASWVWIQRSRRGKAYGQAPPLTGEQFVLLDKLGFRWSEDEKWEARFEELKRFKDQHGHCEVGLVADNDDELLGWVRQQRSSKARDKLDAERLAKLDALGFSWSGEMSDHRWDEMYDRLKAYHTRCGDADVPHRWKEDLKLAAWVGQQRQRRKKGLIIDEQVRRLDELSFTWQHRERGSWEERYQELAEFKSKNGHCNVPFDYQPKPKLGRFVNAMRTKKARGELSGERITLLEQLGFQWAVREARHEDIWEERFQQLRDFKTREGHCKVSTEWPENPQLGHWVSQQRSMKKAGKLDPDREKTLTALGFDWGIKRDFGGVKPTDLWNLRHEQLVQFKQQNGHCDVPYHHAENRQLGIWVANQRQKRRQGKLTAEREQMLNELGFEWSLASRSTGKQTPTAAVVRPASVAR